MKLEEKHQALEEEKIQLEAKLKVIYLLFWRGHFPDMYIHLCLHTP